jgi:hypothetical protein
LRLTTALERDFHARLVEAICAEIRRILLYDTLDLEGREVGGEAGNLRAVGPCGHRLDHLPLAAGLAERGPVPGLGADRDLLDLVRLYREHLLLLRTCVQRISLGLDEIQVPAQR